MLLHNNFLHMRVLSFSPKFRRSILTTPSLASQKSLNCSLSVGGDASRNAIFPRHGSGALEGNMCVPSICLRDVITGSDKACCSEILPDVKLKGKVLTESNVVHINIVRYFPRTNFRSRKLQKLIVVLLFSVHVSNSQY